MKGDVPGAFCKRRESLRAQRLIEQSTVFVLEVRSTIAPARPLVFLNRSGYTRNIYADQRGVPL